MSLDPDPRPGTVHLPKLLRMGRRRAVLTIVGGSVLVAVGLTLGLMVLFGIPRIYWLRGVTIAALVAPLISGVLASWFLALLFALERASGELAESARRDSLTQLYNRGYFLSRLSAEIHEARQHRRRLSLLMIDVDHFKAVNDQFGHPTGDLVLQALGHACQDALGEDDVPARFGGEEFAVMLPDLTVPEAFEQAERVRRRIAALHVPVIPGRTVKVTASIGLSTLALQEEDYRLLIERADRALYRAKSEGRNRSAYEAAPNIALVQRPEEHGRGGAGD